MTVPATTRKAGPYTGNGVQTVFTFSFKTLNTSHVKVTTADTNGAETVLSSGYTVNLNADQVASPGGNVTLSAALATGYKLSISGNLDYDQPLALPGGGNFNPVAMENELDRIVMQVQQLSEQVSRAILASITSGTDPAGLIASLLAASSAAATSANNALGYLNMFKGQYYGPAAADPTQDPLGNAPGAGDIYFNTNTNILRAYSGSAWVDTGTPLPVTVNTQRFSGNSSTTGFTLSTAPAFQNACEVFISGVAQVPGVDYTVSGTTLTFTTAPPTGTNNIFVRSISSYGGGVPNDGSVTLAKLAAIYGTSGANKLLQLDGAGKLPALDGSQLTGLSSGFSNVATFTTVGSTNWTVPAGVTRVKVTCIGGGGGGGGGALMVNTAFGNTYLAGGGGGGAAPITTGYAAGLTPGATVSVVVGNGGSGGGGGSATDATASGAAGSTGGTSSFGTYLTSTGGGAGAGASCTMPFNMNGGSAGGTGAAGGSSTSHTSLYRVNGAGGGATGTGSGGIGGAGGGNVINSYGAGGSGGNNGGAAASGSQGIVIIEY